MSSSAADDDNDSESKMEWDKIDDWMKRAQMLHSHSIWY